MTAPRFLIAVATIATLSIVTAASAAAQTWHRGHGRISSASPQNTISYTLGYAAIDDGVSYDSAARAWGVRATSPIAGQIIVGEIGLSGVSAKGADGIRQRFFIPETQVQLQLPLGPFRPYLGIGTGYVIGPRGTGAPLDGNVSVLSTSIGLRTLLSGDRLTLNLDARGRRYGRDVDERSGSEFTAGFGLRF